MQDTSVSASGQGKITFPVWSILFGLASCFLIGAVYKAIHDCNRLCSTMEGNLYEITNG